MQIVDKHTFFQTILDFKQVPFTQTQGWLAYTNSENKNEVLYLVDNLANPQIACMCHIKKMLNKELLLIESLCFKYSLYKASSIKHFFEHIKDLSYDMVEVVSNNQYSFEFEIGIRRAGFTRPIGNFSIPLSNWIDLQEPITYNSNWKRNLAKSEKYNLSFIVENTPSEQLVYEFVYYYNRFTKEKGFNHKLSYDSFYKMLKTSEFSIGIVLDEKDIMTSAIIFHHKNQHAGLLYAAKDNEAKETGATFFMYDSLFKYLKENGYQTFDMEKLLPSSHSSDGVFLFKDGIKGDRVLYNGEWSWYKKPIYRPLMYFVKKYLMKKTEM